MTLQYYIYLSFILFGIGLLGVLVRRNVIIIFMCIELMLNAVNLLLVAFSKAHHLQYRAFSPSTWVGSEAQVLVLFIMVVAAAEVVVGLSIIVMLFRNIHSVDVNVLNRLKH